MTKLRTMKTVRRGVAPVKTRGGADHGAGTDPDPGVPHSGPLEDVRLKK